MNQSDNRSWVSLVAIFLLGLLGGYFLNQGLGQAADSSGSFTAKRQVFDSVLGYVRDMYVEEEVLTPDNLYYGAIDGLLTSLDDPHTRFLRPEEYRQMQTEISQEFGGLGIYITIRDGWLTVIAPIEGTPAFEAGLMPGDKIIAIDGESTQDIQKTQTAVKKLRGPKGSSVELTVARGKETFEVEITRGEIPIKSVYSTMINPDQKIGYLEIKNFGQQTAREVRSALKDLHDRGMRALMLDLRNNPGGSLISGHKVTDLWIRDGLTVYTRGRAPGQDKNYSASRGATQGDYPMALLVNQGSASGSEIVAGALKDHGRAVVLGDTTFGKGSVQSVFPLQDNSALALTTARWFTPKGHMIQGKGIAPDVVIKQDVPDTNVRRQLVRLTQGDTVLQFVRNHPDASESRMNSFVEELRRQGFTLDERYIRHQIRQKKLALEGKRMVVDVATDAQLRGALDYFSSQLRSSQHNVAGSAGGL